MATTVAHPPARTFPAGDNPHDLAAAGGRIWVADFGGPVREFDLRGHQLRKIALDAKSMAAGAGGVWVGELSNTNSGPQGPVAEISAASGHVVRRLKTQYPVDVLAAGDGAVWAASRFASRITRAPLDGGAQRSFKLPGFPTAIAVSAGAVWVAFGPQPGLAGAAGEPSSGTGGVIELDPTSGKTLASTSETAVPTALLVARGAVWVALADDVNGLDKLDLGSGQSVLRIPIGLGRQPTGLAFGDRSVWALNYSDGTVARVNPADGRVTATLAFAGRTDPDRLAGTTPIRLAVTSGNLWVTDAQADTLRRIPIR